MNERIRLLIEQAEDYATAEYDKWTPTSADDFSGIPNIRKIFNEKFAELIVWECAEIVDDQGRWILYDKLAVKIKKHFGVEP